jgi:hypothetical protein
MPHPTIVATIIVIIIAKFFELARRPGDRAGPFFFVVQGFACDQRFRGVNADRIY